ncbi:MAG TPA: hypothetical protein VGO98_01245 [Candidatus Saccharimonadales bacterium]|nr:hypothetical protein [Candidatus Saccharimonadales bacterium]
MILACLAKTTIINATLLHGDDLDPFDDVTFPVTINGVECDATIATTLDTLTSIDFILADASSPYGDGRATYVFTLKRCDEGEWEIGDKIILVHDTETVEDFYGLPRSDQLLLLGY